MEEIKIFLFFIAFGIVFLITLFLGAAFASLLKKWQFWVFLLIGIASIPLSLYSLKSELPWILSILSRIMSVITLGILACLFTHAIFNLDKL